MECKHKKAQNCKDTICLNYSFIPMIQMLKFASWNFKVFNSAPFSSCEENDLLQQQQSFKQHPTASKHTPTIVCTTHNAVATLSTVTHQLAQSDIWYVLLLSSLSFHWFVAVSIILKPYLSVNHKRKTQAAKEAWIYTESTQCFHLYSMLISVLHHTVYCRQICIFYTFPSFQFEIS